MKSDIQTDYFIITSGRDNKMNVYKEKMIVQDAGDKTGRTFICKKDDSLWIERFFEYDYIHEFSGLMRLPELSFNELWLLLLYSKKESNKIGSLLIIEQMYGKDLLETLLKINHNLSRNERKVLKLLSEYSIPNGAFHWKNNKNLNEAMKLKLQNIWDELSIVINNLLN